MKHLIIIFTVIACLFGSTNTLAITKAKTSKQVESLEYDVYYHWGIIWKKAGNGILSLQEETTADNSKRMHGQIVGKTLSFIEYIMAVRDTLDCWYTPEYVPIEFCKKTNEGSYKAIERNYYNTSYKGEKIDSTTVNISRWRNKKGSDSKSYKVQGAAFDMLSVFYRVRGLDFSNTKPGTTFRYPVFAGIKMQWMNVKYIGEETCKLRSGKKFPSYKVELAINTKGEDGAPLHVWLSKDKAHRPLSVIIQLRRIGAIQCEIVEK